MPRRHAWLQDYNYELDYGPERTVKDKARPSYDDEEKPKQSSPVTINININLGDILDRVVNGKTSTREALEEAEDAIEEREPLTEGE